MEENNVNSTASVGAAVDSSEGFFDKIFVKQAPFQLPESLKEWIVKFGPWITLVILVLMAPALLVALGLGAVFGGMAFFGGFGTGAVYYLAMIASILNLVLMIIALPGLFKRKMSSWKLLYYSGLISLVAGVLENLINLSFGALIWGLVTSAISFYFLFQIKSKYA